jgi:hypothetical protein
LLRPISRRQLLAGGLALGVLLALAPQPDGPAARAGEFVPGIEDLPLMAELHAIEGTGFAFDTAAGRLVEAYAGGDVAPAEVDAFYDRTLPELGWQAAGDRLWRREGETLTIEFVDGADPVTIRFQLSPQ